MFDNKQSQIFDSIHSEIFISLKRHIQCGLQYIAHGSHFRTQTNGDSIMKLASRVVEAGKGNMADCVLSLKASTEKCPHHLYSHFISQSKSHGHA